MVCWFPDTDIKMKMPETNSCIDGDDWLNIFRGRGMVTGTEDYSEYSKPLNLAMTFR